MNIEQDIKQALRDIPDFPKPGIMFKDITPVFYDQKLCSKIVDEFIARFEGADQTQFFTPSQRAGFHQFDVAAYVVNALRIAGLQRVGVLAMDTASDPERFFSYRRATVNAEPDYGRQISCIALLD